MGLYISYKNYHTVLTASKVKVSELHSSTELDKDHLLFIVSSHTGPDLQHQPVPAGSRQRVWREQCQEMVMDVPQGTAVILQRKVSLE